MTLKRGRLSKNEYIALFITCAAVFLLTLLGPTLYLEATGQKTESRADILPKHGTVEYEQFKRNFQAEHGREWTVQDELDAAKNGAYVMIGFITAIMAAGTAFAMVHDLRCWANEKALYRMGMNPEPPMKARTQAIRVLIYLGLALPFGCYMWVVMPRLLIPIP